jgi:hypothetical protein
MTAELIDLFAPLFRDGAPPYFNLFFFPLFNRDVLRGAAPDF